MSAPYPSRLPNEVSISEDGASPNIVPGVAIQAATITEVKNVSYFKVDVVGLNLFNSVTVNATLFNDQGVVVGNRGFTFEGEEYLAWNNDDQYLVNLVSQKLGFTIA